MLFFTQSVTTRGFLPSLCLVDAAVSMGDNAAAERFEALSKMYKYVASRVRPRARMRPSPPEKSSKHELSSGVHELCLNANESQWKEKENAKAAEASPYSIAEALTFTSKPKGEKF